MEEKQYYCEEHNTYHVDECPICKEEKNIEEYNQNTFNFLIIFTGILCIINILLFILIN